MFSIESEVLKVNSTLHGSLFGLPITDTILMSIVNLIIFVALFLLFSRFSAYKPSKLQLMLESVYSLITNFIEQIAGSKTIANKVVPLTFTLVLFILVSNLSLTFLPFLGAFQYEGHAMFRSSTNDFNMTLALSVGMILLTQIYSIQRVNIINYIFRFIRLDKVVLGFRKGIMNGFISLIDLFLGVLDIISEFAKVISLSLRLFGNMFAGELLTGIFMGMLAVLLPIPIIGLSALSGTVQAVVFGALVTSYFAGVLDQKEVS